MKTILAALLLASTAARADVVAFNLPMSWPGWERQQFEANPVGGWQGMVANQSNYAKGVDVWSPTDPDPSEDFPVTWHLPAYANSFGYVASSDDTENAPVTDAFRRDPGIQLDPQPTTVTDDQGHTSLWNTVVAHEGKHGVLTAQMAAFAAGAASYGFVAAPSPPTALTAAIAIGIAIGAGIDAGLYSSPPPDPLFTFSTVFDGETFTGSFDAYLSDGALVGVHDLQWSAAPSTVPEASTWTLTFVGLAGLALWARRQRA